MRRTQWAVFTSMNPKPSAWRGLYDAAPADDSAPQSQPDEARREPEPEAIPTAPPLARFE